ncbi:hypothetical protein ACEWY4_021352 [Coilia grayii]|uniref:Sulfotransferase n=1 Tax=Coilia grayii TaxID=363190 RepID=A0ABD1J946_9TELE
MLSRMRNKYAILIICIVVLVIIEKENNIISRVSDKLTLRQTLQTPQTMAEFTVSAPIVLEDNGSVSLTLPYPAASLANGGALNDTRAGEGAAGGRKHILLLATTRTGSSFVGELFNQQGATMFYLFEPLWHVERKLTLDTGVINSSTASWAYRDVLRQLFLLANGGALNDTRAGEGAAGGRKHILLLATTRTGSSFVGELFNQQGATMFYLFEPLWHVERKLTLDTGVINSSTASWAYRDVLRQLFLCDFDMLESFISPPPQEHVTPALFRRESSMALCEEEVCSPVVKEVFERYRCRTRRCGPLNLTLASLACRGKRHLTVKTVRVRQLETLKPLTEDPRLDMRFIQLVRDPRAILASRMVAFSSKYQTWKTWAVNGEVPIEDEEVKRLQGNCNQIKMSAELGLSRPKWLRGRYMLVRYEDIARYPMQKAAEMFEFTGIPFTVQAKEWILQNTHATEEVSGVYSTQKNSSEQVEKWRFSIPFKLAQVVQQVCGPTMQLFGYKFVNSEQTLLNKSVSLLEERDFNIS